MILLVILPILLGGCWDSAEIEDLFLVWGMGWDIAKDKPHQLTLTLVAPSTEEGAEEPLSIIGTTGHSVEQGRMNAQVHIYRTVQMGHLRILVIGEELAKEGIQKHLDSIGRNPRIGRETLIAVYNGRASDLWEELSHPSNPMNVQYLIQLLKTNQNFTRALHVTFRDYFEALSQEGLEPVTAYVTLEKDKSMVNAFALAAFKENKMVGMLDDLEVQAFQIIRSQIQDGTLTLGTAMGGGDKQAETFAFRRGGTKIKTEVKDGVPHVLLDIEIEGDVTEYTSLAPLANDHNIEQLEKRFESEIKKEVQKVVEKAQKEFESDIFGFGQYFKAYHNQYWKSINWDEEFPNLELDVKIKVNVRRIGIES